MNFVCQNIQGNWLHTATNVMSTMRVAQLKASNKQIQQ